MSCLLITTVKLFTYSVCVFLQSSTCFVLQCLWKVFAPLHFFTFCYVIAFINIQSCLRLGSGLATQGHSQTFQKNIPSLYWLCALGCCPVVKWIIVPVWGPERSGAVFIFFNPGCLHTYIPLSWVVSMSYYWKTSPEHDAATTMPHH